MALEDLTGAKYLDSLVVGNPVSTDDRREGDDHIRGIKNVLRNTFPNLNGAVTLTDEQLNAVTTAYLPLVGGTVTGPLVAAGGVTLGDAAGDALTINSSTASIPNGINFSDGKVGVGATPLTPFQVRVGTDANLSLQASALIAAGAQLNAFNNAGSTSVPLEFGGSLFLWQSGGVERMRIDAAGNAGFKAVPSVTAGDWSSIEGPNGSGFVFGYSEVDIVNLAYGGTVGAFNYKTGQVPARYTQSQGQHIWSSAVAGAANAVISWIERMRIDAAGVASFSFGTKTQRTWQAVGASRNFNTDYTAPAYDIELSSTNTTTANSQLLELVVNGVSVASDFNAGATNTCIRLHGHVIPAGATYRINATANITKGAWSELR